jgi:D-sedoheptulose 7-phosphate isomerase
MNPIYARALDAAARTFASLDALAPDVERAAEIIGDTLLAGGQVLVAGNGGSAADAADFATEFACRFAAERRPYPALNLSACGSLLTATANDYGVAEIFARPVRAFGRQGDVFVGITTSGNSANLLAALTAARERGLATIALLGRDGGQARGQAQVELIVPGEATARIQEAHKFLLHTICELIEPRLAKK